MVYISSNIQVSNCVGIIIKGQFATHDGHEEDNVVPYVRGTRSHLVSCTKYY